MSSYWPEIVDLKTAKDAAHQGAGAAVFVASVTCLISTISIFQHRPILGIDGYALVDAALFAVVAWRTYKMSRPWAVVGLLLYVFEIVVKIAGGKSVSATRCAGYVRSERQQGKRRLTKHENVNRPWFDSVLVQHGGK